LNSPLEGALPGNAYLVALPPVSMHRWQSHRVCIPRQSPSSPQGGNSILVNSFPEITLNN